LFPCLIFVTASIAIEHQVVASIVLVEAVAASFEIVVSAKSLNRLLRFGDIDVRTLDKGEEGKAGCHQQHGQRLLHVHSFYFECIS
jgi:hypothetical protein